MALAIADFLPDFSPPSRPAPAAVILPMRSEPPAPQPQPAQVDVDAIVADAVAKAEADLGRRLETLYEERAAEDKARHEEEMAALRVALSVELAAKAAAALSTLEDKVIRETTSVCARILSQVVDADVCSRAVAALAVSIRGAIGDAEAIRIRVSGPQSLFMPFAAAMGDHARHLEFIETESYDLTVSLDETLFETRLAEWSSALTGAVD
jgi:hypothetical protein